MKRIAITALLTALSFPLFSWADDVIPSVSKEEMSSYKNAFGKAISDSRRAEGKKPESGDAMASDAKSPKDNFGSKVSDAARNLKADILKDNKNFGAWVSKQHRPDDAGNAGRGASDNAKGSTPSGRPDSDQDGSGHGKGHGNGSGHGKNN